MMQSTDKKSIDVVRLPFYAEQDFYLKNKTKQNKDEFSVILQKKHPRRNFAFISFIGKAQCLHMQTNTYKYLFAGINGDTQKHQCDIE